MTAVATSSSTATMPRIFICVKKGLSPMKGTRNRASDQPAAAAFAGFCTAEAAARAAPPGRVAGPPAAGRLVMVEDCAAVRAAAGLGFGPVMRFNHSANEDLGFIVCALAICLFSLRA